MKKRTRRTRKIREGQLFLLFVCLAIALFLLIWHTYGKRPEVSARAAILIDARSGEVIYAKDTDTPYPVASMSKMMTEYLVLEHIRNGALTWEEHVTVSRKAAHTTGASIAIQAGDQLRVRDLFIGMALPSANNAAVALAEHIAGSETEFVRMMNNKARELGLSSYTQFVNATGLTEEATGRNTMMTAADVAALAFHLVNDFPEILDYSAVQAYELEFRDLSVFSTNDMLHSTNPSYHVQGLDGLKTGYTAAAGYCFTGTAARDGKRLISVVMGSPTTEARFMDTKALMSYGYHDSPSLSYYIHRLFSRAQSTWVQIGRLS
ncbi:D-alanyl-D-alanine carboxypeptidase family protein [Paenibacillus sp. FSL M8-0334]|uniref:D-alanyl-D-alanine carboxypeptidase n=1 Tax=Paenibacillus campinasensis TaxID=66347 RepID=A0ABW9T3L2_9BACL|nr:D-alanyl-D-alanine carboxypeptidase family protein [Paenibacillus campinasensis]MUG67883.1 D-alanyl-D-alanine carboxypeptidase [Paenibacillus campinasensis]